jgi:hypothetical protein
LNWLAKRLAILAAAVMAAAPVWADQAQDAARIQALSYVIQPSLRGMSEQDMLVFAPIRTFQDIQISGCKITLTHWYTWASRDVFSGQVQGVLGQMQIEVVATDFSTLLVMRPGSGDQFTRWERVADGTLFSPIVPDAVDYFAMLETLKGFPVVTSEVGLATLSYDDVPRDQVDQLVQALQSYADQWCGLAS